MNYSKSSKLPFVSKWVWRKICVFTFTPIFKGATKQLWNRSSILPRIFHDKEVHIYVGNRWKTRFIRWWMIGHKGGSFTWNKQRAVYKAKQKKKLKKK